MPNSEGMLIKLSTILSICTVFVKGDVVVVDVVAAELALICLDSVEDPAVVTVMVEYRTGPRY